MKKGQILEGYIERVDFPNKGFAVVEDEEKKVIVKNTVPEQKVRFAVNKIRKGQAEGRLLEILEHSRRMSAGMSAFWSLWRMHLSESAV